VAEAAGNHSHRPTAHTRPDRRRDLLIHALTPLPDARFDIVSEIENSLTAHSALLGNFRSWYEPSEVLAEHRRTFPRDFWTPGWAGRFAMRDIVYERLARAYRWRHLRDLTVKEHIKILGKSCSSPGANCPLN